MIIAGIVVLLWLSRITKDDYNEKDYRCVFKKKKVIVGGKKYVMPKIPKVY